MINVELRKLARRYRDGEEMEMMGSNGLIRFKGLGDKLEALREAREQGFTSEQLHDEVAQIDVEEDDVR